LRPSPVSSWPSSPRRPPPSFAADLKLSDAAFVLEDVESERRYRERYYGTLSEP
jgi:hypothetical protein